MNGCEQCAGDGWVEDERNEMLECSRCGGSGVEPWYDQELTGVVDADCLVYMQSLPDLSVDHVIGDPPYDEHTHAAGRRGCTGVTEPTRPGARRAQMNRNRDLGFDALTGDQMREAADVIARIVRRWVLLFSSHEMSHDWRMELEAAGLEYVRTMIWIKRNATPQFTGDRPATGHECIVLAHRTDNRRPIKKRWNGGGKHGVYYVPEEHDGIYEIPIVLNRGASGEQRVHTTQKPLRLMEQLVTDFTDPGEYILDPYCGSGTTLVACRRSGREGLGVEIDGRIADVARGRLAQTREQPWLAAVNRRPERREQLGLLDDRCGECGDLISRCECN